VAPARHAGGSGRSNTRTSPGCAPLRTQQIRIEQVRDLAADLALTSHAGGYKVGIVTPAEALNRFAANALLKRSKSPRRGRCWCW